MQLLLALYLIFFLKKKKVLGTIDTKHCVTKYYHKRRSQRMHRTTKFALSDVVLQTDSQGKEYLVYSATQTKGRQGDNPRNVRSVKPRMYENKEISDAPFYLTVNHLKSSVQGQQNDCTWLKAQPMYFFHFLVLTRCSTLGF